MLAEKVMQDVINILLLMCIGQLFERFAATNLDPSITYLSPQSGGLFGNDVVLCGENFPENPRVFFGEEQATVHWSDAKVIFVKAPSSDTEGPVDVKLEGQESNNAHQYRYEETKLSMDGLYYRDTISIHGTGFRKGMSIWFENEPVTGIDIVSDKEIRARAPVIPGSGIAHLKMITPGETQNVSARFKFHESTIYNVTPSSGALSGGEWIDIYGANFVRGQHVVFGNAWALETKLISANNLRARVPAAFEPGPVPIRLSGSDIITGDASPQYEYVGPAVTDWAFSSSGTLAVTGRGFRKGEQLVFRFGQTEFISDKELRVHFRPSVEHSFYLADGVTAALSFLEHESPKLFPHQVAQQQGISSPAKDSMRVT